MDWTNPKPPEASPTEETVEEPVQKAPNHKLLKAARNLGVALALPAAAVAVDMADPSVAAATHECGTVGGIPVCKPHSSTPTPTTRPASTPTTRRATTATTRRATTATTRGSTATSRPRPASTSAATPQKPAAQTQKSPNTQPPVDAAAEQARLAAEAQAAAEQARLAAEAQAAEAAIRRAAIAKQLEGRDTEQVPVPAIPITLPEPVVSTEGAGSNTREANPWVPIGLATAVIGIGGLAAIRRSRSESTVHQDLSGQPEDNEVPVLTDQVPQDSSITVAVPAASTAPENSSVLAEA